MRLMSWGGTVAGMVTEAVDAVGRGEGLEELYVRTAPAALRLAYFLTGDRQLAEDLVQEAFVRVAGRFHHRRVPDDFSGYLRRTIVNTFTSQLRRRRLERAWVARQPPEPALTPPHDRRSATTSGTPSSICPNDSARRWSCGTTRTCPNGKPQRCWGARSARSISSWSEQQQRSEPACRRRNDERPRSGSAGDVPSQGVRRARTDSGTLRDRTARPAPLDSDRGPVDDHGRRRVSNDAARLP
jgi:RNA polymerase sigma factor (sigma-70 family)